MEVPQRPHNPTLRQLASELGLSIATVSEGLRDSPRVHPKTIALIKQAATRMGYVPNPILGAALSAIRKGTQQCYRGLIALVDCMLDEKSELMLFHKEICVGARERAREQGFNTELFWLGRSGPGLSQARLSSVLAARGINAVIFMPFHVPVKLDRLDFSRISAVQMDHTLIAPHLHTILPDHYISMVHALERLTERGYARIGLCLEGNKDNKLKHKWSAAFTAFIHNFSHRMEIPPLIKPEIDRKSFLAWYCRYRPEIIVAHLQVVVDWLAQIGVRVPDDVSYFNLNHTERTAPCAGLDLQPRRLGAAAVDTVVAMLYRNEYNVPRYPQTITLPAEWIDGPTLRDHVECREALAG